MSAEENLLSASAPAPEDITSMTYALKLFSPGIIAHTEIYEIFPDGKATLKFGQKEGNRDIVLEMVCHTSPKLIQRFYSDILACTKQAAEIRMNAAGSGNTLTVSTPAGDKSYPNTLRNNNDTIETICSRFISGTQLKNYLDSCMYQI